MKIIYVFLLIVVVVLIYFFSVLTPLPWYIYPPFISLFLVAFYWDRIASSLSLPELRWRRYLPWQQRQRPNDKNNSASNQTTGKRI